MSTRCTLCHTESQFAERAMLSIAVFHQDIARQRQPCPGCHTEHRGLLAQTTSSATKNPHGELIFAVTGTRFCTACHVLEPTFGASPTVMDNDNVRRIMTKGSDAHRPGHIANCLQCHADRSQ